MSGLAGAVETAGPVSKLHARQSFDPADFPVPNGREEEWRFTPLRRLRGLHADAPFHGKVSVGGRCRRTRSPLCVRNTVIPGSASPSCPRTG